MEKFFQLKENNTTVGKEVVAGLTTFFAMAYIIAVNPTLLSQSGMEWGAVFLATIIASVIGTLIMGLVANVPYALAPGMGLNAFFVYTVCATLGFTWQQALSMVFICGVLNIIITVTKIRKYIIKAIPRSLQNAIGGGIGIFVAYIGLLNVGIISFDSGVPALATLNQPAFWLFLIGLALTIILLVCKVKGAILIGIVATALLGKVQPGITYTYKIRAYSMVNGTAKYSDYTAEAAAKTVLATPSVSVKVSSGLYNTVNWNKISGAAGYVVYRKTSSGKWTKLANIKKASTTSYKDTKIKSATIYEYTVRAYCTVNKKTVASSYKSSGKYKSAPSRQTVSSVSNTKKGLKLKWKAQKKCDGYYIYKKTGSGKYKLAATIKKGKTSTWTDKKVKKGKKYRYYVRAYVKEPNGVVKGKYKASAAVTRK